MVVLQPSFFIEITLSKNKTIKRIAGKEYKELLHKNFLFKIRKELEVLKTLGLDNGLNFKPVKYKTKTGDIKINIKTMVFQKGIDFIRKLLEKSKLHV